MKTCPKCEQTKPLDMFHRDTRCKDGLKVHCKTCRSEYKKEYMIKNAADIRRKNAEWYMRNYDRAKNCASIYRAENAERLRDAAKQWRINNKGRVDEKAYQWRVNNKDRIRLYAHMRRVCESKEKLSPNIVQKLYKSQRGKCACCGLKLGTDYHLDHIMPIALGGANTDNNVQLLRKTCNLQKNRKHPVEFMQLRGFLL